MSDITGRSSGDDAMTVDWDPAGWASNLSVTYAKFRGCFTNDAIYRADIK